ncbi:DinB family protein [Terrimonas rubra]|uniref:DinB family protein n=1 Tax=Terrimonas rubra TaxID=1035890 RepID=A0ABW6A5Y4_9BACT
MSDTLEVWMRGPVEGVPALLQPVAHALLQAVEDAEDKLIHIAPADLWQRPNGVASVGFHLLHMRGVVDRMFTYSLEKPLSETQFAALKAETEVHDHLTASDLVTGFKQQVTEAITQLKQTKETGLTATRYLGRKRIPVTLIGLLFHAAEHIQRHTGQALVTARML